MILNDVWPGEIDHGDAGKQSVSSEHLLSISVILNVGIRSSNGDVWIPAKKIQELKRCN
jgi:hypothetical protein